MMQRHMPIGYRMQDGKIHQDKEKAKVVRMIFKKYLSGLSTYQLAKQLTDMGFLNANNKPSWNHGSIGRILENVKYLGDSFYPSLIEKEIFEGAQKRRESQCRKLGRQLQPNSMKHKNSFSSILRCGECGEVFHKYVEHCGKSSEKSNWKCRRYIHKNKVQCSCGVITEEQIKETFLSAVRKMMENKGMLKQNIREKPYRYSLEYRKVEQRVEELEAEQRFGQELAELIYKRAEAAYQTAEIKDHSYNTEIMKAALEQGEIKTFERELFERIVRTITIYEDGRIQTEFINGITIDGTYETRKQGGTYADKSTNHST